MAGVRFDPSRRRAFRNLFGQVAQAVGASVERTLSVAAEVSAEQDADAARRRRPAPLLRPPGAVAEADFLAGCTRCMDCAEVCPHDAIVAAPARLRAAAGTPVIDPATAPCLMCEDRPCVTACGAGVLRPELPPRIGTARIDQMECLAYRHQVCTTCADACPVAGAITQQRLKPTIQSEVCTGCGVCHNVCPAPRNAVLIHPIRQRPTLAALRGGGTR